MSNTRDVPTRATSMETSNDIDFSTDGDTIGDVIARRYNRRDIMKGALGVTAATAVFGPAALAMDDPKCPNRPLEDGFRPNGFDFEQVKAGVDGGDCVANGYDAKVLISWGDHLHKKKEDHPFVPTDRDAATRRQQYGYNNDYIAYLPLDNEGNFIEGGTPDEGNERGLLCVNHEFVRPAMMFPGTEQDESGKLILASVQDWMVDIELESVGVSIIEIEKKSGAWEVLHDSPYNCRITVNSSMTIDGPVVDPVTGEAHDWLKTNNDPSGKKLIGTAANCAGGMTPWGTYLTTEENIQYLFSDWGNGEYASTSKSNPENYEHYGIGTIKNAWGRDQMRFNLAEEPNEPNRFGWIVEIDPFDKGSVPVKHSALGRFYHEGAETVLAKDGRVVVYSGDDRENQFVYRFVSKNPYRKGAEFKKQNMQLLSEGTLFVARFDDNGRGQWIPLTTENEALKPPSANGRSWNQAEIALNTRVAAKQVGATKMDRPEDIQPNERTRRVYLMLTNNDDERTQADKANPRVKNPKGHIIEMIPDDGDFAAGDFSWNILVKCGEPEDEACWSIATEPNNKFVCPDNAAVDSQGRLWIATDQGKHWYEKSKRADGLYALETHGPERGTPRLFYRVPVGAEATGPCFTPNGETLFLSVQHPGTDGVRDYEEKRSSANCHDSSEGPIGSTAGEPFDNSKPVSFENPASRWPDFKDGMPPRPSVVVITRKDGGKIGG